MMAEDLLTDALVERIQILNGKPGDHVELMRSLTSKLHARASSSDTNIRQSTLEKISKLPSTLGMLTNLLESTRDIPICTSIAGTLREAVCFRTINVNNPSRQIAVAQMIKNNATSTFTRILHQIISRKDSNSTNLDLVMYDIIWVLSQLSQKDPKFAIKVRLLGGVKMFHGLLRLHFTNNKVLFPLLNILKQLSKNQTTAAILVRDGAVPTYDKILVSLGPAPTARLRLSLDAVDYLSRNKVCCSQMLKSGMLNLILRIFDRWDKYEGKIRLKLCLHILQTLQHVCVIKTGRRTLASKKHIQILHRFCTACPDDVAFDRMLSKVSSIICLCLNNKSLPVPANSPAVFTLKTITQDKQMSCDANDETESISGSSSEEENDADEDVSLKENMSDQTGSESECLLDDAGFKQSTETLAHANSNFTCQSSTRDIEDLKRYNVFFREFIVLQNQLKLLKTRSNSKSFLMDYPLGNICSSDLNLNKTEHSNLLQSSYINSLPSLLGDMDDQVAAQNSYYCDIRYKKCDMKGIGKTSCSMKVLRDISPSSSRQEVYAAVASRVRSIIPFIKVAYPDLHGAESPNRPEYLNELERSVFRKKIVSCVERAISCESLMNEVVYDLDALCADDAAKTIERNLTNTDALRLTARQYSGMTNKKLEFESRFESGNLRKAIQIGPREYDLILMPDVNSTKRHLWFYFEVSNMTNNLPYVFNIVNCEKSDSQFNFGMKPVMYSVKEATLGRPGWVRAGADVCYYRNSYQCVKSKNPSKCYLTVTFTMDFPHANDVCYIAYHYPYTYSQILSKIWLSAQSLPSNIYFRMESLCYSLNSNEIPLITITAEELVTNPIHDREIIFLTSRVHPGESNASWVMDGTISSLLENTLTAHRLRAAYVFKIVPILNVEGVINGCYRCGLTNEDLNRRWSKPSALLHPDIYHTKGLMEYMSSALRRPATVYCDFHGHSRKKNVFLYGCSGAESWCSADRHKAKPEDARQFLALPLLMQRFCGAFSLEGCSFQVEREREATARVTAWRHLGVPRAYTLEASFCGFDQGPYKGLQLSTRHLRGVGAELCAALAGLRDYAPPDLAALSTTINQADHNGNNIHPLDL